MAKKLDRSRPYGEIMGGVNNGCFEQDGILFGPDEREIVSNGAPDTKPEPEQAADTEQPENVVSGEAQVTPAAPADEEPLPFEDIPEEKRTAAQKRARTMEAKRRAEAAESEEADNKAGDDDVSAALAE